MDVQRISGLGIVEMKHMITELTFGVSLFMGQTIVQKTGLSLMIALIAIGSQIYNTSLLQQSLSSDIKSDADSKTPQAK
jgi:1,4-dihydroxy-2-naphthoate octaprenyltransferase